LSKSNRYCRVNDADLFVEDFGSGPLMLFMHGFSFDSRMWQPQLDFFARDYRVLAYDARGFGRSSLPGNAPWSPAGDLSAVLDEVAADPAILVAHSMAAIAACDFCRQSPGRIKALILVSPSAAGYRWPEIFMAQWAAYQDLAAVDMDAARNAWLGSELFTRSGDNALVAQQMRVMIDRYSGWHWQQKKPVSTSALAPSTPQQLDLPVLLINGSDDAPAFLDCARVLAGRIGASRQLLIDDADHMCNMEQPVVFNRKLAAFIASLAPA
jgi:3-oxoadipate enol-lactonase